MRMKLVMPHINRMVRRGSATKWLKSEGDRITYGDDLLELRVNIGQRRIVDFTLAEKVRLLTEPAPPGAENFAPEDTASGPAFDVRITASDTGVLRRICVREGERLAVGDLVALLTTEATEFLDESPQAASQAGEFRVVVNILEST